SMSSIGPSSTIRPGETKTLLKLAFSGSIPAQALIKHLVTIEFCYCSLNHNCWMLRASPGHISQDPSQVPSCANRVAIESNSFADAVPAKRPASRRSPLLPER
ncbi:MAG TPA: hypothetical protein VEW74_08335, partial [Candidatus Nitrosotalea sp.]|nr:hypothetical protein [Candidatus Nitrosotalea sp.]